MIAAGDAGTSYPDRTFLPHDSSPVERRFFSPFSARRAAKRFNALAEDGSIDERGELRALRGELRAGRTNRDTVPRLFATVARSIQVRLDIAVHPDAFRLASAMLGARGVACESLADRRVALLLAVSAAASTGAPVHLLCASGAHSAWLYDAARRALEPLGISVATVAAWHTVATRKRAYRADVVVTTPREITLDHLRDNVRWPDRQGGVADRLDRLYGWRSKSASLMLPGLYWAFFDRLDQTLIDDARIPVVIGPQTDNAVDREMFAEVYELSGVLEAGSDFTIDRKSLTPSLTVRGIERVADVMPFLFDPYAGPVDARALLANALRVRHLLEPDRHYLRHGDRLVIPALVPGQVGMTALDLFQLRRLLECREPGARVVAEDVVARITYLGFFRKYHHLAGAATSVRGIGRELARLYGLRVQHRRVRLRPRRSVYRCRVLPDRDALVGLLARPATDAKKERRLLVVVANSAGERDDFLDRFHRAGFEGAADLERGDDDTLAPTPGIRVTILREFLPFCADSSLFESFYRVDVYFVGLPPSSRQLRECAMPTLHGRTKGELWQLMTAVGEHENDTAAAPLPLGRLGPLAASRATRLLVRPLLQLALRARERAEAETRAAVLSHQASIDELFAFSGRGRT